MAVVAIVPEYRSEIADVVERFHGQQLLYIGWDNHLMYPAPLCIPVPPEMPFNTLFGVIPQLYAMHPDTASIDWETVQWTSSGSAFVPDPEASLVANGLGHKAVLRFVTPGLTGVAGSGS